MSKRAYVELADGSQTHYRFSGSGVPLILLHASPLSSAWMEPTMAALPEGVHAIAPDTPGYGASDPLTDTSEDLSGYAAWLKDFIAALGFGRAGVYGSSTGAQIAIEFARGWPEAAHFLVLDNAAHFTDAEREHILAHYFPDLSPREDGSHLQQAWEIVNATWQWFPWFERDEAHRVAPAGAAPLAMRQAMLIDQLRAGPGYAHAYRRAFLNEDANRLRGVTAPTRIIRWQASILRQYADRLDDMNLPANIQMAHCGPTIEERLTTIATAVADLAGIPH